MVFELSFMQGDKVEDSVIIDLSIIDLKIIEEYISKSLSKCLDY